MPFKPGPAPRRTARKYDKAAALWPKTNNDGHPYFGGRGTGLLEGRYVIVRAVLVQHNNGPAYEVLVSEAEETPNDETH